MLAERSDSRGGDSWGWYDPKRGLFKGLGDIAQQALKMYQSNILMGHTRKGTTGAITKENSHPFEIGNIIGAHNGMLTNHSELNNQYKRSYAVDSMHIFGHLNEGRDLSDIGGYGAIEFIRKDQGTDKINLCKLEGGDLHIYGIGTNAKNCKGIIWASVDDYIEAAAKAAGIKVFAFKVETGQVYSVDKGMLYLSKEKLELRKGYRYGGSRNSYGWYGGEWENVDNIADIVDMKSEPTPYRNLWEMQDKEEEKELVEYLKNKEAEQVLKLIKEEATNSGIDQIFLEGKGFVDISTLSNDDAIKIGDFIAGSSIEVKDLFMPKDNPKLLPSGEN